jgi:hypothetical protein
MVKYEDDIADGKHEYCLVDPYERELENYYSTILGEDIGFTLAELANTICTLLQINSVEVIFDHLNSYYGIYLPEANKIVLASPMVDFIVDGKWPNIVISTLLHELAHHYINCLGVECKTVLVDGRVTEAHGRGYIEALIGVYSKFQFLVSNTCKGRDQ